MRSPTAALDETLRKLVRSNSMSLIFWRLISHKQHPNKWLNFTLSDFEVKFKAVHISLNLIALKGAEYWTKTEVTHRKSPAALFMMIFVVLHRRRYPAFQGRRYPWGCQRRPWQQTDKQRFLTKCQVDLRWLAYAWTLIKWYYARTRWNSMDTW